MRRSALSGVVLAGGRSRRMRRSKARLRVDGLPLWQRQEIILRAIRAEPILFALRPRQRSLGRPPFEIRDALEDAGPLAGIHAALTHSATPHVAVLAVDMAAIEPGWFHRLLRSTRPGCGAVFRGAEGIEPLAAIYPREALSEIARLLRQRDLAVHRLVERLARRGLMKIVRLPADLAAQATNWNRPSDLPF